MADKLVRVPPQPVQRGAPQAQKEPTPVIPRNAAAIPFHRMFQAGIGRVVVIELRSGSRISGEVLNVYEEFVDTDSGIIRLEDITHARWMSAEEASIARGSRPLGRR